MQKIQDILGGGVEQVRAMFFAAPASATARAAARPAKPARVQPARPRIYYKWVDGSGYLRLTDTPPTEDGRAYAMIRALD